MAAYNRQKSYATSNVQEQRPCSKSASCSLDHNHKANAIGLVQCPKASAIIRFIVVSIPRKENRKQKKSKVIAHRMLNTI